MSARAVAGALLLLAALAGPARTEVDHEDVEAADQLDPAQRQELLAAPDHAGRVADAELLARVARRLRGTGKWAFRFSLAEDGGAPAALTEFNAELPMIPASTMKLLTGRLAFERGLGGEAYLRRMLRLSVNEMADKLLEAEGGPPALLRFVAAKGWPAAGLRVADGSGLSGSDRVTAGLETALLEDALASADYDRFRQLLARPDVDSTLRREGRLRDLAGAPGQLGRVYAKTGTLPRTGVVALAGFVELESGGTLVFSILGNALQVSKLDAREALDDVVRLHVRAAEALARARVAALGRPRFAKPSQLALSAPRFD